MPGRAYGASLWLAVAAAANAGTGAESAPKGSPALDAAFGRHRLARAQPQEFTGRDFGGLRWSEPAREGRLELFGARSTRWMGGTPGNPVYRLLLEGDVRVHIGALDLTSARAVVWLEPISESGGTTEYQFFIYFDRLAMPTAAPDAASQVTISGDRVPVKGTIRVPGGAVLRDDARFAGPPDDSFVREGERSLAAFLRSGGPGVMVAEGGEGPQDGTPDLSRPFGPGDAAPFATLSEMETGLAPAMPSDPIFAREGIISIAFGQGGGSTIRATEEDGDSVIEFDRGVVIQYRDRLRDRALQLTAERGVIYLREGLIRGLGEGQTSFDVADVRGFYLEGDVIVDATTRDSRGSESHYAVRTPRAYYDVQNDRAVLLDAVFWTYDQRVGLPLYVRAKTIRQESAQQFSAGSARMTNTGFVDPFVSLGVETMTLTRREPGPDAPAGAEGAWIADAEHLTGRVAGVPALWWPRYVGDPTRFPLRELGFGDSFGSGMTIRSAWDAMSLLGIDAPAGTSADLLLDYYFERGLALGTRIGLERKDSEGDFLAYVLPDDTGTDHLSTGGSIEHDGDTRSAIVGDYQERFDEYWTMQLELSYFSDPTVVDTFFRDDGRSRREFANAAWLDRTDDETALTLQLKGSLNDFTPNEYLLQDQGYTVDRLPEATYTRVNDDLLPDGAPGLLAYNSEYRVGMVALSFTEPTAAELGFTVPGRSVPALGIQPNQSPADRLRAEGYTQDNIFRFDTRQEVSSQLKAGPVNVVPFVVGRITAYDQDFSEYAGNDDKVRTWGAVGTRFAAEVQRVDNDAESRLFDIHRIRHIVEPGLTLWYAGTNIDQSELPVYDDEVESIADGAAARIGVHQTWQTQRGGPGRYRSVDFLTLNADFQFSSEDSEPESPVGRWFDYRPEYSNMGDFFTLDSTWQATEVFALSGRTVYDFSINRSAATSAGFTIQHTPEFRTGAELLYLDVEDSTFVNGAVAYDLTTKHSLAAGVVYDTNLGTIQQVSAEVLRRFPSLILGVRVGYNQIAGETNFGVSLTPVGLENRSARIQGLGSANDRSQSTSIGQ